jgi:hypothetical protein
MKLINIFTYKNKMEQIRKDIQNIITLIKSNVNGNYSTQINSVLKTLQSQTNQTHEIQLYVVLLQFILNTFSTVFIKVNHIKQGTKNEIDNIIKEYNDKPYSNIDFNVNMIKQLNNDIPLIAPLLDTFMLIYRKKQLIHISKFYSKIKLDTLSNILGKEVNLDNAFFSRLGWIKKDNHVVLTKEIEESDIKYEKGAIMENIAFIEQMNIQYEKLINKHKDIKAYADKTN